MMEIRNTLLQRIQSYHLDNSMEAQAPLLDRKVPSKSYITPDMTPIHRYNIFIDCYNMPCNVVNDMALESIPESGLYAFLFGLSAQLKGKILFVVLCMLPFLNVVPFALSVYFAYVYWASLRIYRRNAQKIRDPFKRMSFDPEKCFNMGCDYYFFTIELKELDGFMLNYQQNVSERLDLRKERGKTNIMIYNHNFWASYNYFERWGTYHYTPMAIGLVLTVAFNVIFIIFIAKAHAQH